MKRLVVGLVVLASVAAITFAQGRSTLPQPVTVASGRFLIVNGTPEFSNNIMLLDTATGDSWIYCAHQNGVSGWCFMPRSSTPAGKSSS